jgi:4-hydroxybenzoate polyprenyltransferase
MRLGLFVVGVILIVGGLAGIKSSSPYELREHRGVTTDLPKEKQQEPLDSGALNPKLAGWMALVAGASFIGLSFWCKGMRAPKPHDQPPVESQPYV